MTSPEPTQRLTDGELDEMRDVIGGGSPTSSNPASLRIIGGWLLAEVDRLRAENTALREARDGECPRCRFPLWSHDLWTCVPNHMAEFVGDDELRREVILRELNQGALAGMSSEITGQAADLVLAAINRYDAWRAEPDPRDSDLSGEGQANG